MKASFYLFLVLILISSCRKEEDIRGIISFTQNTIEVSEGLEQEVSINVGINRINHDGGTINMTVEGGIYGEDYVTSFGSDETDITIPAGSISEKVRLTPLDNDIEEENRIITLSLNGVTGDLQLGSRTMLSIRVLDDDAPVLSEVSFETDTLFVDENTTTDPVILLLMDLAPKEPGEITIRVSGDALPGIDYEVEGLQDSTFTVPVNPGAAQARFRFSTIDNDAVEEDKIINFTIDSLSEFLEAGFVKQKVVVIRNDDE